MSNDAPPSESAGFWESRTGWGSLKKQLLLEPLLGGSRWAAAFGSLLLFTFVMQVVTGILLTMNYAPSVETAYPCVKFIQEEVPLGWLIRGMHHWGSSVMVVLLLCHMAQVFVWGAYKRPRELTWVVGVLLLFCALGLAFTGYLLPWDQKAYWATKVGLDIAGTAPLIGDKLHTLLQGGPQLGNLTLTRFFTIHTFLLPGTLIFLTVVHLYLFRLHGVTPPWWESASQQEAEAEPFWPGQVWKDSVLAFLLLSGWAIWCLYNPAPLGDRADPAQSYQARPEWYFMFLFRLLRYFEGPYEVVGTFILPVVFVLLLLFWPFLDRTPQRDPRRRPVSLGLFGLGSLGLIGLTIWAIATDVRMTEPAAVVAAQPPVESAGPLQKMDVAKIYNTNCASCHGVDGSGDLLRKGMPTLPDFTSLAWQMSQTDLAITHQIREGNEPLMPAYHDKLSKDQIFALAIYVRAFAIPSKVAPPAKGENPPPVAARMSPLQVYRAYCLACHDADGKGETVRKAMPEIPDFASPKWETARTDAELAHTILDGKGKFMLPMKDKLGGTDVKAMVAFVRAFQGGKQKVEWEPHPIPPAVVHPAVIPGSKAPPEKSPPSAETAARLRVATGLYRQYCLTCHGTSGRGSAMRAAMPAIPNFTDRAWQATQSDALFHVAIMDGKGAIMPSFQGRLSDPQVGDLIAYLRAFGPPPQSAAEGTTDFAKHFQKLQQQWNELEKQLQEVSPQPKAP